jgi:hypothetical protein
MEIMEKCGICNSTDIYSGSWTPAICKSCGATEHLSGWEKDVDIKPPKPPERPVIDKKFKFTAVNPCNLKVYTEHNAVIFCAKDKALLPALNAYRKECIRLGCQDPHVESMDLLIARVQHFQDTVEAKTPDTDGPCEIDRCIGGKT